jgi:formate/nitrite transporter FocA (FNT family)
MPKRESKSSKTSGQQGHSWREVRRHQKRVAKDGHVTEGEIELIEERSTPRTPVIYELVRRRGEEEMARPITSLWWSGVAAGLSISFSLLAQAILQTRLPDASWSHLIISFGYSVGFLMVVLGRQQLFTENTITIVLPVMADFTAANAWTLGRVWGIVFLANMAGTCAAALFCTFTPVLAPELRDAMLEISRHAIHYGWIEIFFRAISAGFLIAAMVWLLPSADAAQFHVITLMTYLIGAGGFAHIVAGSMEAFLLVAHGELGVWPMFASFTVPVLLGNIVGGTALFALLSYGQVMKEL